MPRNVFGTFVNDKVTLVKKSGERFENLPASVQTGLIELLRHMLNWAVGREYLEKTPFRRGMEL